MAMYLGEILRRPAAPWVLRILAKSRGGRRNQRELYIKIDERFHHQEKPPLTRDLIDKDLVFLFHIRAIEETTDGQLALTPAGEELAKEILPAQATHVE